MNGWAERVSALGRRLRARGGAGPATSRRAWGSLLRRSSAHTAPAGPDAEWPPVASRAHAGGVGETAAARPLLVGCASPTEEQQVASAVPVIRPALLTLAAACVAAGVGLARDGPHERALTLVAVALVAAGVTVDALFGAVFRRLRRRRAERRSRMYRARALTAHLRRVRAEGLRRAIIRVGAHRYRSPPHGLLPLAWLRLGGTPGRGAFPLTETHGEGAVDVPLLAPPDTSLIVAGHPLVVRSVVRHLACSLLAATPHAALHVGCEAGCPRDGLHRTRRGDGSEAVEERAGGTGTGARAVDAGLEAEGASAGPTVTGDPVRATRPCDSWNWLGLSCEAAGRGAGSGAGSGGGTPGDVPRMRTPSAAVSGSAAGYASIVLDVRCHGETSGLGHDDGPQWRVALRLCRQGAARFGHGEPEGAGGGYLASATVTLTLYGQPPALEPRDLAEPGGAFHAEADEPRRRAAPWGTRRSRPPPERAVGGGPPAGERSDSRGALGHADPLFVEVSDASGWSVLGRLFDLVAAEEARGWARRSGR